MFIVGRLQTSLHSLAFMMLTITEVIVMSSSVTPRVV
jgi:hypothetical protein